MSVPHEARDVGADRMAHAASWYHNLRAQPEVVVQIGTRRAPVTARIVLPDDADYERLWELVNANNKQRYAAYQRHTSRPIPIIVLSPR